MENNEQLIIDLDRFKFDIDGQTAFIEYRIKGDNIFSIRHTEVPKALEGRGIAGNLTKQALTYIKNMNGLVEPRCPYTISYMKRHPEWNSILAEGSDI